MNGNKGFTLIELLVVLVIIGIVSAIAVPQFSETREMAYYAAMKSDLRNLAAQQELHYATHYSYATSLDSLGFVPSEGDSVAVKTATNSGWSATATHKALDAATEGCAIFYGDAAKPTSPVAPAAKGVVECTG